MFLLGTVAALSLSSCLDTDEKILLNPDGSGKAYVKIMVSGGAFNLGGEKPEPAEAARDTAMGLLGGAKGVEAWSDVKYGVNDKGITEFSGLAYFPDITKYSVGSMDAGGMKMKGGEKSWTMRNDGGTITLVFSPMGAGEKAEPGKPPADVEAAIKKQRMEFQQSKPMMTAVLGEMKTAVGIKVGGAIQGTQAFEKKNDSVASMAFSGADLLKGVEKAMMDDVLMRKLAAEGKLGEGTGDGPPPEVMEKVFGGKQFEIVFKAGAPLFDYKAEVAKAKASMKADVKKMIEEAKESAKTESFSDQDEDSKPAGAADPGFEAFAKKHVEGLKPTFTTKDGKSIKAVVGSSSNVRNDGKVGHIDIKVTLSDGTASEEVKLTISFSKSSGKWEPMGSSSAGLPDFLGKGLDRVKVVGKWAKDE